MQSGFSAVDNWNAVARVDHNVRLTRAGSSQHRFEEFHHRLPRFLVERVAEFTRSLYGPCAVQVVLPGGRYQGDDNCKCQREKNTYVQKEDPETMDDETRCSISM